MGNQCCSANSAHNEKIDKNGKTKGGIKKTEPRQLQATMTDRNSMQTTSVITNNTNEVDTNGPNTRTGSHKNDDFNFVDTDKAYKRAVDVQNEESMQIDMRTKSNAKTEVDEKIVDVDFQLKNHIVPDDEDGQIRQIEAVIKKERQEGIDYPFIFMQGKMIRSGE